jgi:O-antigen ligase
MPAGHRARGATADVADRLSLAIIVGAVAVVPWITTPMTIVAGYALGAVLGAGFLAWTVSLVAAGSRPHLPTPLLAIVGTVLAYGWLMTVNGLEYPDLSPHLFPRGELVPWLPGAVDRRAAFESIVPLTGVFLAGVALVDHCRVRRARLVVLIAISASATVMSAVATVDRLTAWSWPFNGDPLYAGGTPFVSFGYHGNAAASLELALPATVLLAVILRPRTQLVRTALAAAPVVILVGVAVNVSKLGQVLALAIVAVGGAVTARDRRITVRSDCRRLAAFGLVALLIVGTGAFVSRGRWQELPDGIGRDSGRALTWEVAARAAGRSPVFGAGPGGFKVYLLPVAAEVPDLYRNWIVTPQRDGEPTVIWQHVHNDPLQTVVEWGPLGATALATLVLWPLALCADPAIRSRGRAIGPTMTALALTVTCLHGLFDFPFQVPALQLTIAAWAAVGLGEAALAGARQRPRHLGSTRLRRHRRAGPTLPG